MQVPNNDELPAMMKNCLPHTAGVQLEPSTWLAGLLSIVLCCNSNITCTQGNRTSLAWQTGEKRRQATDVPRLPVSTVACARHF